MYKGAQSEGCEKKGRRSEGARMEILENRGEFMVLRLGGCNKRRARTWILKRDDEV